MRAKNVGGRTEYISYDRGMRTISHTHIYTCLSLNKGHSSKFLGLTEKGQRSHCNNNHKDIDIYPNIDTGS